MGQTKMTQLNEINIIEAHTIVNPQHLNEKRYV
jgi:hypothetical protein